MRVCTSPCERASSLIWVHVPHDSAEYARYEAAEKAAHEVARATHTGPQRAPGAPIALDHARDMALIAARRPASAGAGLYLFPAGPTSDADGDGRTGLTSLPTFKGWLPEADAMVWLCAHYPWTCEVAAACMGTCAAERSLCACGVVDPAAGTVRFYAVPALARRRRRRPKRHAADTQPRPCGS
ncbi:hypothetical protein psal_cds_490 [Pandoravirus salinus]|uniref:Uncharacterized protein n=1 Tax=Pandoravirus salinus TaxID=1349410 RepID=S4W279_9VIRU|nr:hypothetical protein psal_cds_490 [Pandoravirus salinus]AGO84275.1 hypothetical protein psal_cds_490 [Pandoravirus salinus]